MSGVAVHGGQAQGKLVVTLETATEAEILERLSAIQLMEGVLSAALVYHHCEPIKLGA
jgi:nitrate reductase NapD